MLLVSDYDGTYSNNDESIYLNNEAIEKFMKDGNTFVLSSGRSYTSLLIMATVYLIQMGNYYIVVQLIEIF